MTGAIDPANDAELRRKNRNLGLIVGTFVLAILGYAMYKFTIGGLPADADEWAKAQQRASAEAAAPTPSPATSAETTTDE